MNNNLNEMLSTLSSYQTNKDQSLGSIIATAASHIASEARLRFNPDSSADYSSTVSWNQQAQVEAERH